MTKVAASRSIDWKKVAKGYVSFIGGIGDKARDFGPAFDAVVQLAQTRHGQFSTYSKGSQLFPDGLLPKHKFETQTGHTTLWELDKWGSILWKYDAQHFVFRVSAYSGHGKDEKTKFWEVSAKEVESAVDSAFQFVFERLENPDLDDDNI